MNSPALQDVHMSVLVVDDDDVDRERVLRLLRRFPLTVDATEAASGSEALDLVRDHSFDCIVLDNHLGDIHGSQLLKTLQGESRHACPVIMVTGEGDERVAVKALQEGASDYVSKRDLNADVLLESIQRSLEQYRLRNERSQVQQRLEKHVQNQALLIEQRERDLQSILDHMPALVGYWDATLRNRFGNRAYDDWFGVAQDQLPGMHMREVIGDNFFLHATPFMTAALCGEEQLFEYTADAPNQTVPHHYQAQFIPDIKPDGQVTGFYSFVTDVTPVKVAQARAGELASFNEAVIQSSPIGIAVYRSNGRCILANKSLADTLGCNKQDLLSKDFRQQIWWRESALLQEAERTLKDGKMRRCEAHTSKGKRPIWLECSLAAIDYQGDRRLLLIAHDVTAQRAAQTELASARDAARAAAAAKSNFLANMSHEIRTPMNAIVGLSRLSLEDALPARARDFIDKVHSSALALMGILDDVLDYSKIEAGQLRFESVEFDVDELLQRVADLFAVRVEQKGLALILDIHPNVPSHLIGDPLRLSQVLDNLIGNAVKFTEQGNIVVSMVLTEKTAQSCVLEISVQDTGVGISPETQKDLFGAFTQADNSITRRYGGSGLGLAICKSLVQQMGGDIVINSSLGTGSVFHFTAKLGLPPLDMTLDADQQKQTLSNLNVLVVDENLACRQAVAQQLKAFGAKTQETSNSAFALELLAHAQQQGTPFNGVILDWAMPQDDNIEILHRIHAQRMQSQRPFHVWMMVSSFGRDSVLSLPEAIRPSVLLAKPVLRKPLLQAVSKTIQFSQQGKTLDEATPSSANLLNASAARLEGALVLLVEDNPVNQLVAEEMLKRLGVSVTIAQDGIEAVEAIQRSQAGDFDAILMDLHMPQMDGFEATRRIHSMAQAARLPIIAMSAAVLPEDRAESFAAGMVDHLAKPVVTEQLVEVLAKWIHREK